MRTLLLSCASVLAAAACSGGEPYPAPASATGGTNATTGGSSTSATGGATGGAVPATGGIPGSGGATGGNGATAGSTTTVSAGGSNTGGTSSPNTGGTSFGGFSAGGSSSAGAGSGGRTFGSGGKGSGGISSSGGASNTGGKSAGGTSSGGSTSGGTGGATGGLTYSSLCASCHGDKGEGVTSKGPEIQHPVRDFSTWVVRNGRSGHPSYPGSLMAAFPASALTDAMLTSFFDALSTPVLPKPTTGAALFADFCANCHGATGVGGPAGHDAKGEPLSKALSMVRAGHSLTQFSSRTGYMPKWSTTELTDAEVGLIVSYLDSL